MSRHRPFEREDGFFLSHKRLRVLRIQNTDSCHKQRRGHGGVTRAGVLPPERRGGHGGRRTGPRHTAGKHASASRTLTENRSSRGATQGGGGLAEERPRSLCDLEEWPACRWCLRSEWKWPCVSGCLDKGPQGTPVLLCATEQGERQREPSNPGGFRLVGSSGLCPGAPLAEPTGTQPAAVD